MTQDFEIHKNKEFIRIADELKSDLIRKIIIPKRIVNLKKEKSGDIVVTSERAFENIQIWMILAEVLDGEENKELILRTKKQQDLIPMVTPYMYHQYVEALVQSGMKDTALEEIKYYWGNMIMDGADTFWELYNPEMSKKESPYGSSMVNSYCHAWSCTPAYFLRKKILE